MKRVTITLPDDLTDKLALEARCRQTSLSELVRQLIVQGLSESTVNPRQIPWANLFHDPGMAPAERMEDELAEHWADEIARDRD